MTALTPRGVMTAQESGFYSYCYYNIIIYNKNINIYIITDNIFSIYTINYK
jgi:hypothetical protein